jgi:cyclophilin family peptidyl-prolyl cis-trans isomerase
MMTDSLLYEPIEVHRLMDSEPESHARLAEALGRIGDPRAVPDLERLLVDSRPDVRRNAAFALGILGESSASAALKAAVADDDRETGRLAVEALARLEEPFENWAGVLEALPDVERYARLLPTLFRLPPEVISSFLSMDDSGLTSESKRWILYAAGRSGGPDGLPLLRSALKDADPWILGWAAKGIGRLGSGEDLELLAPRLADASPGPVIQALRAGALIVADGRAAAPTSWLGPLRRLLVDPRAGVRMSALEAAGYWLLDDGLEADLLSVFETGSVRERQLALAALVKGRSPDAESLVLESALSESPALRGASATGARTLGLWDVLSLLWQDPEPGVRLAVLEVVLADDADDRAEFVRSALRDDDAAVRAAALDWLSGSPVAPVEELLGAIAGPESRRLSELGINGVRALAARGSEPLERGAIIAALEELARDEEFLIRRQAAKALAQLGRPAPATGWIDTGVGLRGYQELAMRLEREPRVAVATTKGEIVLELACQKAPLTCSSFLLLINQGFYDGLTFHRVVPDFVVQGGDPRGDGWGGPGYSLRDESSRLRFERGVVGMARSGHHTAGSQFFITLSEQPHLDGAYTSFGFVTEGDEILNDLVQGDEIITVRQIGRDPVELPALASGVDSSP